MMMMTMPEATGAATSRAARKIRCSSRQVVRCLGELALDVLDDHHRRIDQHADGDGEAAQAHQVGRQADGAHQDEGGERRERQHQRDDQRRAQVAEEGEEQQDTTSTMASISALDTVPTARSTRLLRS
jgi:hypothetical protein